MANSLGALVVRLGLDAAEFTQGLTKAEYQAQQFARNTRSAILDVAKVIGGLEIGRQVIEATKAIISEAAALNDLADATGSSVESLSRLNNQAKIAGTSFDSLQTLVLKLSQGMAGTDEESNKAAQALKLLGITTKDPVQALQEVAVKLSDYRDGVEKVGLAVALFGKQGGQFVATLKDIAELQDVGATVSAKQAAEAENLEKAYRRLSVESEGFKNTILNSVVPALLTMIQDMSEGVKIAGGLFNAIALFGTLNPFDAPAEGIKKLRGELEELRAQKLSGNDLFGDLGPEISQREKQINFLLFKQRQAAIASIQPGDTNVRDQIMLRKPAAPSLPGSGKEGKALKEQISDADRYLQSLEKQYQGTLDLSETETALSVIYELRQKSLSGLTAETEKAILDYAAQIDAAKALTKAQEAQKKLDEDIAKTREKISQQSTKDIDAAQKDAQAIRDGNEQLREQLVFLKGGQEALDAYKNAKLEKLAVDREDAANAAANAGDAQEYIDALKQQAALLRERVAIVNEMKLAEKFKEEARALQDVKNMFADTFADAFTDIATGAKTAKQAFIDLANSIVQQITRIAAQQVANKIFGGNNSAGPDIFGIAAKLLGAYFGSAGGGISTAGGASSVGFGGADKYALGGVSRGGLAMVGENGPELVSLASGDRVFSNAHSRGMMGGTTINNHFSVQGPVNRATEYQIAQAASRGLARAGRR